MTPYIIQTKNLEYAYPNNTLALRGLSISIEKGKKIGIVGPNGAGKTTLFLNLNGVYTPTSGQVYFQGKEIHYSKKEIGQLRKEIGIVFQDANAQLFSANVFQEISFGPMNLGLTKEEVMDRVNAALEMTSIVELKDKPTHFLSGGQKKRVAIADILAMEPEVIFLDEPTAFVDPKTSHELMKFFDKLNAKGKTIVLSTHDIDRVYSWADYVFVMKDGMILGEGIPEEIFRNEDILREADLDKPWIIEVYEEFIKTRPHLALAEIPKTKDALLEILHK